VISLMKVLAARTNIAGAKFFLEAFTEKVKVAI
jgi:hypothetical protein